MMDMSVHEAPSVLAAEMRRIANNSLLKATKHLEKIVSRNGKQAESLPDPGNLRLSALYLRDAADYIDIAYDLGGHKLKSAARIARNLESSARDEIPANVWNFLLQYMDGVQAR